MTKTNRLSYKNLLIFFVPLGISASLTSITHVIINGTLSRGENAAHIIASYAVAMSLFVIIERPMVIFRQTASTLVQDQRSFKTLRTFFIYILLLTMLISSLIAFTPLGGMLYTNVFNAEPDMVQSVSSAFQIIIFVIMLSGIRALYQGIIINQLETNWITVGVVSRLIGMVIISVSLVYFGYVTSATGSLIFLAGMVIEMAISVYKGHSLLKTHYPKKTNYKLFQRDISRFYTPLVGYFLLQSILNPMIYVFLAKSEDIEMSIASFALAFSIANMILGFFMYTHQLVLQFYGKGNNRRIFYFVIFICLIPNLLLALICFTPFGMFFMNKIMGADDTLAIATIAVLKFFLIKTIIFPWVDFLNGFLMLKRETNKMLYAQVGNLGTVFVSLFILVIIWPQLDGVNGSIAASLGEIASLLIVGTIILRMRSSENNKLTEKGTS